MNMSRPIKVLYLPKTNFWLRPWNTQTDTTACWCRSSVECDLVLTEQCVAQHCRLVEAEVTSLPASVVVVSGLHKDFLHLPRRGHVTVFSELDKNLSLNIPPLDHREYFTLQVRVSHRRVWPTFIGDIFSQVRIVCAAILTRTQDKNTRNMENPTFTCTDKSKVNRPNVFLT